MGGRAAPGVPGEALRTRALQRQQRLHPMRDPALRGLIGLPLLDAAGAPVPVLRVLECVRHRQARDTKRQAPGAAAQSTTTPL